MDIHEINSKIDNEKFELLKEIFSLLNYTITNNDDLFNIILNNHSLRNKDLIEKMYNLIPKLKQKYKSSKLTCLHINSIDKQKFPCINMIRQILKCNNLKLHPYIVCKGYNKSGKKICERYFTIIKII